ncbi:MAG: hypothetical protein ACYTXC_27100 [Nostoc sp.]
MTFKIVAIRWAIALPHLSSTINLVYEIWAIAPLTKLSRAIAVYQVLGFY